MNTEREWWDIEILTARTMELYVIQKRRRKNTKESSGALINFLRQWNRRQGSDFELSLSDEDYMLLTLGERATKHNTKDKTVLLIGSCTESLLNLRARAEYANHNSAKHVFVFSSSLLDQAQHSLLEEVCQAFFYADPCAGGVAAIRAGKKGHVLRTVSPPKEIDCSQVFLAIA